MPAGELPAEGELDAELGRLSELDRQEEGPGYERWAARSAEREVRRAQIPFPGLAAPTHDSLGSAERIAALR